MKKKQLSLIKLWRWLQLRVTLSQFNQPVEITAPESAQPLSEVMSQFFSFGFDFDELPDQKPEDFMPDMMPSPDEMPAFPKMEGLDQQQQQILEEYGF